jgi:hypothetical protein
MRLAGHIQDFSSVELSKNNRNNSVCIANVGVQIPAEASFFCTPEYPDRLWADTLYEKCAEAGGDLFLRVGINKYLLHFFGVFMA